MANSSFGEFPSLQIDPFYSQHLKKWVILGHSNGTTNYAGFLDRIERDNSGRDFYVLKPHQGVKQTPFKITRAIITNQAQKICSGLIGVIEVTTEQRIKDCCDYLNYQETKHERKENPEILIPPFSNTQK